MSAAAQALPGSSPSSAANSSTLPSPGSMGEENEEPRASSRSLARPPPVVPSAWHQASHPSTSPGCAAGGRRARRQQGCCCSQTEEKSLGETPRTVTGRNVPELLDLLLVNVQHRKVSGRGKRKCTSPHL